MAQVPARAAGVEEISGFRNPVLILIWMHECRGFARCLLVTQSGHAGANANYRVQGLHFA